MPVAGAVLWLLSAGGILWAVNRLADLYERPGAYLNPVLPAPGLFGPPDVGPAAMAARDAARKTAVSVAVVAGATAVLYVATREYVRKRA